MIIMSSSEEEEEVYVRGSASCCLSAASQTTTSSTLPPPPPPPPRSSGNSNNACWGDQLRSKHHHHHKLSGHHTEIEMMKERFAKLLLGEDMSGAGRGLCSALAISNAITNLAASVFGEVWRLEPLPLQKRKMWCREMGWLLSVNDSIVDLVPSTHECPGGGTLEVMETRVRSDLYVNLPALKKLDSMLLSMLEGFKETEFWYVDQESNVRDPFKTAVCSDQLSVSQKDKWWLPCPRVPEARGLSEEGRKRLQQCRDCANQILKAAMAINSSVIEEMEVPCVYLESLPKNGKDCLGDVMYSYITAVEEFSAECLLDSVDLSSEHLVLEVANRIEAAIHIWISKDERRHGSKPSSWSGKVKGLVTDNDKNHVLAYRAEMLLRTLKLRFPVLPQTVLDMTKIQCNQDVGQAILESYSRVMESLAFNIVARIDDLLFVDEATKQSSSESKPVFGRMPIQKRMSPSPFSIHHSPYGSLFATGRSLSTPSKQQLGLIKSAENASCGKVMSEDFDRIWLHPSNLNARDSDAPERD